MKQFPLLILLLFPFSQIFCGNLEETFQKAGKNRPELEKVLEYYSVNKKDSLKYKAAYYLISNLTGHFGIYHTPKDAPDAVFEKVEKSLLMGIDTFQWKRLMKSPQIANPPQTGKILYDVDIIKADFLIKTIESAFYAWETFPWCKGLDFETFKQHILPYRVANEPLLDLRGYFQNRYAWLTDSMKNKLDMGEAFTLVYNDFYKSEPGNWQNGSINCINNLLDMYGGTCYDECVFKGIIMRSLGIVCSFDYTPHWGNRSSDHTWNAFIKDSANPMTIEKDKQLQKREYLNSAIFPLMYPDAKYLPADISLMPAKKGAKAFRKLFETNPDYILLNNPTQEKIPPEFNDPFLTDVSRDYLNCFDVDLEIPQGVNKAFAYICVFDLNGLYPVDWGSIMNNKVTFKNMGSDVLYFATIYVSGAFYPFTSPFILQENGEIRFLEKDSIKLEQLVINRKYPLFGNILNYANLALGARFEGSNVSDFSKAAHLYTIRETSLLNKEITVKNKKSFRYYRYLPIASSTGDLAELQFYTIENGKEVPVTGVPIYKYIGPTSRSVHKVFDNNMGTFYKSDSVATWFGIDLGEGIHERVTKISYCPRTDTNFIIPGNAYELFYWDNTWVSLGRKMAAENKLFYENAPSGCLFWLHCHNGGVEERPFTFENGKQVWW